MAHLTCKEHKRRVVVLETGRTLHRSGDGSPCESPLDFMFGGKDISFYDVEKHILSTTVKEK